MPFLPLVGGRWSHVGNLDEFFTRVSSTHGTYDSSCSGIQLISSCSDVLVALCAPAVEYARMRSL